MTPEEVKRAINIACVEYGYEVIVYHVVEWLRGREREAAESDLSPAEQAEREVERRDCEALAKLFDI
jgi:hypothetical protein